MEKYLTEMKRGKAALNNVIKSENKKSVKSIYAYLYVIYYGKIENRDNIRIYRKFQENNLFLSISIIYPCDR